MLTQYIALVSETKRITPSQLTKVGAALQKQVTRDFDPRWGTQSSVSAFVSLDDVPSDYWPVMIQDEISYDAAGIHLDKDGQPFALVAYSDDWSLTSSHEVLEMLADPFGNRLVAGQSPKKGQGRVNFLVEVCDPSEAAQFGYTVNGVLVSDFYFSTFFDPTTSPNVRYSFTGAIKKPRHILRGGYLSWEVPETREWWQSTWFSGSKVVFRSLGRFDSAKHSSLRAFIDHNTVTPLTARKGEVRRMMSAKNATFSKPDEVKSASSGRAAMIRQQVTAMLK